MQDDPRFAQALEDLIRAHGPEADALVQAIKDGDLTINYDYVHARADGTINIARFTLDTPPQLPHIKLPQP
ncbi:MAG: hypothetical protein Q4D96_14145 [Propionibacteriaceae bacterium]|nr:hypothetical protein [Propionibacteriaceae bacterium]